MNALPPRVQLLGDVCVLGAPGPTGGRPRRLREIVAYLALEPGRSERAFSEALFPEALTGPQLRSRRNTYLGLARSWMGPASDGTPCVGLVPLTGYRLHESVDVDWDDFQDLVGADPSTAGTADLESALTLVQGRPMGGLEEHRWDWAMHHKTTMCERVAEVGLEAASRAASDGRFGAASRWSSVGLLAEPGHEGLWDVAIRAARLSGGPDAARDMTRRARRVLQELR